MAWHPLGPAGAEVVPWEGDEGLRCASGTASRGSPEMAPLTGQRVWVSASSPCVCPRGTGVKPSALTQACSPNGKCKSVN